MNSATFRKGKRYGILGHCPEAGSPEAELWDLNQRQSPLFSLPPEIRNKIYDLVLANHRIHVLHTPKTPKPGAAGTGATSGFHCLILHPSANPFAAPTDARIRKNALRGRGLTLLSPVCRQLYLETVLIPYATGTWSFATPGLMERYLLHERRVPLLQRRAVRRLVVRGIRGNGTLSRKMRGYLGGLEVVWFWDSGTGLIEERIVKEVRDEDGTSPN